MSSLTRDESLSLLEKAGCSRDVIAHCIAVSKHAVEIAEKIRERGFDVDVGFVETAALLHDVGRSRSHTIRHGVEGALILRDYPHYARVCERHIGAGIDKSEAAELGLPARDYMPETLEEKIIAHADNLVDGSRRVSFDEAIKGFERKLGRGHPGVKRIRELNDYITSLLS